MMVRKTHPTKPANDKEEMPMSELPEYVDGLPKGIHLRWDTFEEAG